MNKVLFIVGVMLVGMTGYAQTTSLKKEIEKIKQEKIKLIEAIKVSAIKSLASHKKNKYFFIYLLFQF